MDRKENQRRGGRRFEERKVEEKKENLRNDIFERRTLKESKRGEQRRSGKETRCKIFEKRKTEG